MNEHFPLLPRNPASIEGHEKLDSHHASASRMNEEFFGKPATTLQPAMGEERLERELTSAEFVERYQLLGDRFLYVSGPHDSALGLLKELMLSHGDDLPPATRDTLAKVRGKVLQYERAMDALMRNYLHLSAKDWEQQQERHETRQGSDFKP